MVTWGLEDDSTAVQEQLKNVQHIQASLGGAFAAILGDERFKHPCCAGCICFHPGQWSVVTWDRYRGGNSSAVQAKLRDVQHIQASRSAFAANPVRWICRHLG